MANAAAPIVLVLAGAGAGAAAETRAPAPDLHTCSCSNRVYDADASLMGQEVPTHFRLMTSRYVQIVQAARGKNCTGTATVAFNGHNYTQAGMSDDPGIAQLIPNLSSVLEISLAVTFDITIFALVSVGTLIGYAGFWRCYTDRRARWAGTAVFLCLALAQARVADVYIFQIAPLIAGIPWVLHFALRRSFFALYGSAALLAFCCSWCSLVRIGTTSVCLVFLIAMFAGRCGLRKMLLPILLLFLACVPCILVERNLIARRDVILAHLGESAPAVNTHPIWHAIYTGLGFVPNSEVRAFNDTVALEKVQSVDAAVPYTSPKYEAILRHEILRLAEHKPMVLIENVLAKTAIVFLFAGILLFPARRLLFADRDVLWLDTAFVLAIGLSAMNAILVVPKVPYLLTFFALTFLYSSLKLCGAGSTDGRTLPDPGRG